MSTFTIDAENNITAHAGLPAGADESQSFSTAKELAKLTAEWPGIPPGRHLEQLRGRRALRRTEAGKEVHQPQGAAVARIWQAVARLSPDGAQPAADVAPAKGKSKKSPAKAPRRARAQKGAS